MMFEPQFYAETVHAARFTDARLARAMLRRQALRLREEDRRTIRRPAETSGISPARPFVGWLRAAKRP